MSNDAEHKQKYTDGDCRRLGISRTTSRGPVLAREAAEQAGCTVNPLTREQLIELVHDVCRVKSSANDVASTLLGVVVAHLVAAGFTHAEATRLFQKSWAGSQLLMAQERRRLS